MRMLKRMTRHMGPTRPFQVYLGMYSGMCVWYDTCPRQRDGSAYVSVRLACPVKYALWSSALQTGVRCSSQLQCTGFAQTRYRPSDPQV